MESCGRVAKSAGQNLADLAIFKNDLTLNDLELLETLIFIILGLIFLKDFLMTVSHQMKI